MIKTKAERGAELERLRLEKGLTRYALAKRAGVSSNAVMFIETGKVSPSLETWERLLDAMGYTLTVGNFGR